MEIFSSVLTFLLFYLGQSSLLLLFPFMWFIVSHGWLFCPGAKAMEMFLSFYFPAGLFKLSLLTVSIDYLVIFFCVTVILLALLIFSGIDIKVVDIISSFHVSSVLFRAMILAGSVPLWAIYFYSWVSPGVDPKSSTLPTIWWLSCISLKHTQIFMEII